MADMVTNTVGIMLFILIFVSLSAGGVMVARRLPRERHTEANAIWMYCSGGRVIQFDPSALGKQLMKPLGEPSLTNAGEWARRYSAQKLETDDLVVSGEAVAGRNITALVEVRGKAHRGDDQVAVKTPGSAFQRLLAEKSRTADFFFFFVAPDSIAVYRAARDQAAQSGFSVGWTPLALGEPARISLSGGGREATIQ
jgi:hypothetical protein